MISFIGLLDWSTNVTPCIIANLTIGPLYAL